MMHRDHVDVPTQRQASSAGVLPIVAAVESVRLLRDQLEFLPIATASGRDQLRNELDLLRHWLQTAQTESLDYHSVVEGFADFATAAGSLLDEAEIHDTEGRALPSLPL